MSSIQRIIIFHIFVVLVSAAGCGSSGGSGATSGGASMDTVSAQAEAQQAARKQEEQTAAAAKAAEEKKTAEAQASAAPEMKKAGRSSVGPGGYYTAIVGARRHILNETESWAWKQAVQHFRATEGRKPKDHAEFMKRIVEEQGISLGFKEENQEFFYDPNAESDGDLGVVYVVEKEPATSGDGSVPPAPAK